MSTAANQDLLAAAERIRARAAKQEQTDKITQELSNCRGFSNKQLTAVQLLKPEFGDSFAKIILLDPELLQRTGPNLNVKTLFEQAKVWLADRDKREHSFAELIAWTDQPPANVSLEEILRRIHEGEKYAESLRERAEDLAKQFAKL